MSLSDDERYALVTYRLEKAHKTLEQVKTIAPLALPKSRCYPCYPKQKS